jgi:hypothetical protein
MPLIDSSDFAQLRILFVFDSLSSVLDLSHILHCDAYARLGEGKVEPSATRTNVVKQVRLPRPATNHDPPIHGAKV